MTNRIMWVVWHVGWFLWHVLPIRPIARLDERYWLIGLCSLDKRGPGFLVGTLTERANIFPRLELWSAQPRRPLTDTVARDKRIRRRKPRSFRAPARLIVARRT